MSNKLGMKQLRARAVKKYGHRWVKALKDAVGVPAPYRRFYQDLIKERPEMVAKLVELRMKGVIK